MPQRIAHVISARGVGGGERILSAVVAGGVARGLEQVVLNPFAIEESRSFAALCEPARYEDRHCEGVVGLPALRRWLGDRLDAFQPDIVHVMLFHALLLEATLPRRPQARRVLTQLYDGSLQLRPHKWATLPLEHWAAGRFDRIVAISDSVKEVLVREYKYPESRVVRISPGW